ncbi:MAG TPA: aldo/keto reductase, partial [Burkholderiales bacterium]
MNDDIKPAPRLFTRREALAMTAGLAAAALGIAPAGAATAPAKPLLTRPIPRTGERLAVVGLGTAIIFDIAGDAPRIAERRTVIETLLAGGARLIDTAPSYGAAESVVGDLLAGLKVRDKVFVATKVRAAARDRAIAEMQQSQRRLRTEKIDLMQIHNVGFVDRADIAAQLALLREWKERGVFRYIGVTHSQSQARANERLIEILRTEKLDFIQVNYSMAERSVEERLLPAAAATGTAVLVNLPFARARLFRAVRGKPVPAWAAEFDASTWGQFFLKYLLASEAV